MKKLLSILFALLMLVKPAAAADFITCTCTITNAPTVHGNTITVNGSTRAWTNSVVTPSSQILTNNTIGGSATNLFNHFGTYKVQRITTERSSTNAVKFHGFDAVVSVSANWATVVCTTNVSTNTWVVTVPFEIMVATNRTIVASQLTLDLTRYSTNAFNQNSNLVSELVGLTNAQTISGIKTFTGASVHSSSGQTWTGGTISATIGRLTNGYATNMFFDKCFLTNGINYGNAFSSVGSAANAEQFGASASATTNFATAVGATAAALAQYATAVGGGALADGVDATALGSGATAGGSNSVALGSLTIASKLGSVAIGNAAESTHTNSVALGASAATTENNQVMLGSSTVNYIYANGRVFTPTGYTNATHIGTNVVTAGIHFTRLDNTSLANGNNAAVDIGGTAGGSRTYVKVSGPTAVFSINGIAGGANGRFVKIENSTGFNMTIVNDSGVDPTAANRIYTGTGSDVTITNNPGFALFSYDSAVSRWKLENGPSTSVAGVTSVALTAPTAVFDIAGSPVTGSGTLAITFDTQSANTIFSGPTTGAAAAPTFRALVAADIPISLNGVIAANGITNTAATASRFVVTDANKGHASTGTSVNLSDTLSDETGTGNAVFSASPTFTGTITAAAITASDNVVISTAGKGLQIKEGSNAKMGTATLVDGTVTVSTTAVTANSRIFLTRQSSNGSTVFGLLSVGTVTAGTSFTITARASTDATILESGDDSVIAWMIVEPAP
jgi:hypothetical protein